MVSEYGFQSFPSMSTLSSVYPSTELDLLSKLNEHRQHHFNGTNEMIYEIEANLKIPWSFQFDSSNFFYSFIYLSQINQAMSLKTATEFFIRNRVYEDKSGLGKCMGALYWQLNDIWQAPSWSTIEYGGKHKISHYYVKNAFSQVLISPFVNDETKTFDILVISEHPEPLSSVVNLKVQSYDSFEIKFNQTLEYSLFTQGYELILSKELREFERLTDCQFNATKSCLVTIEYLNEAMSDGNSPNFFFMNKKLAEVTNLKTPTLKIESIKSLNDSHFEIILSSDAIALFVWLDLNINNFFGKFSDNGFHMTSPNKKIIFMTPSKVTADYLRENLKVISLMNIYDSKMYTSKPTNNANFKTKALSLIFLSLISLV
jgi:beta-mannosidase